MGNKYGVYWIRNIINNKKYIGSTGSDYGFDVRWKKHKCDLKHNKHPNCHLQRAWNKYGEQNFEFNILEECNDDMLIIREQRWINYYDTMNPLNGYNLREAGKRGKLGIEGRRKISEALTGKKLTEEHKKKLSDAHKGVKLSEERRERQSKRMMGHFVSEETKNKLKGHPNYNTKPMSEETRLKISKSLIGNKYAAGYKHTKEWKEKARIRMTNRIVSQETREKISKLRKGMVFSDETKRKISEANIGRIPWNKGLRKGVLNGRN